MKKTPVAACESMLKNIEHSMQAEGFTLSAHTKLECRQVLAGQVKADQAIQKYIQHYARERHG